MQKDAKVVVTGVGPISSIGIGKKGLWNSIIQGKTNVRKKEHLIDGELWDAFFAHSIDDFSIDDFQLNKDIFNEIMDWKKGEELIDFDYLVGAIKLALDDSELEYWVDENNISLVLAHENLGLMPFGFKLSNVAYDLLGGEEEKKLKKIDFFKKLYDSFSRSGYDVQSFANLHHITKLFNIHNYSLFINNACASGLYAIEAGAQIIKSGLSKSVVVATSDQSDIYKYIWFKKLGIYSEDGVIRPFSQKSNGLVFGDGGAAIVLEDSEHAMKRDANIYAEYAGGGFDLEGWKMTMPKIGSGSYQRAILEAIDRSDIGKEEIELVCPHGIGVQMIDSYEARAMTDIFGKKVKNPLFTTFKPYIGHNLGGSALIETIILLIAIDEGLVPPTLNCEPINSRFDISLLTEKINKKVKVAMKTCCAFAGYNAAVIFKANE